jgi:hypothetical protein
MSPLEVFAAAVLPYALVWPAAFPPEEVCTDPMVPLAVVSRCAYALSDPFVTSELPHEE